jgi:hypothetical protein
LQDQPYSADPAISAEMICDIAAAIQLRHRQPEKGLCSINLKASSVWPVTTHSVEL